MLWGEARKLRESEKELRVNEMDYIKSASSLVYVAMYVAYIHIYP